MEKLVLTPEKMILTREWHAEYPFAGQKTQNTTRRQEVNPNLVLEPNLVLYEAAARYDSQNKQPQIS